jgi:hypothetical protein
MKQILTIERLRDYAVGWWMKNGYIEWPSVRRCARSLGVSQAVVIDLVNEDADSCLEYWNTAHKPGDEFVCIINHPVIEKRYPEYKSPVCERTY